ncbi:AcvB/VirJ family lysyl-phosphatidylglycerol hydrolase [Pedobacter sp. KACC 23697]|uniref:AcvB/VirJ family lysyl-phosphatidylglycerol hydrolase n=1 Tax=Pedobacter sp. KACC 23697 TaxID=3149230 RepID=A0AAU7K605_9SPHI
MKKYNLFPKCIHLQISLCTAVVLLLILSSSNVMAAASADTLSYAGFGKLRLYKSEKTVENVIICISGDGGWNAGIEGIALHLKDEHTLLIGVDIRPVFRAMNKSAASCLYPAADFERMSQFIQKKLGYKTYNVPVLLGYSSGATLVYGLLAQAPQNTFRAGIVLGFCPDINIKKPLCKGSGKFTVVKRKDTKGYDIGAAGNLSAPLISLQGENDKICNYASTTSFLKNVGNAKVVSLPGVGHGYGNEKNWVPQLMSAYKEIIQNQEKGIPVGAMRKLDLPLHLTEAKITGGDDMVVFISGDGGWTGYDQQTVNAFAERGAPVVGLDALKYFWEKKSPSQLAEDVTKIIETYAGQWKKQKVILVGYSFGADVMSFAYNRLPENLRHNVLALGLLSPSKDTDFEIHVSDLLSFGNHENGFSVPAEINRVQGTKVVCFFGKEETDLPVKAISTEKAKIIYLQGGHHYVNSFDIIATELIP